MGPNTMQIAMLRKTFGGILQQEGSFVNTRLGNTCNSDTKLSRWGWHRVSSVEKVRAVKDIG